MMGALGGFRYREIAKRLKHLGLVFHRQAAGSHEIWFNPALNRYTTPNHPATCPRLRCAPFSSRLVSMLRLSCTRNDAGSYRPNEPLNVAVIGRP